jgi:beta-glucanase (GH16 family)
VSRRGPLLRADEFDGHLAITVGLRNRPRSRLADGFHAYPVHWEPGRIRWFFDGTLYHTVTPAGLGGNPWVFDHDCCLLLNVAVGGSASVPPDRSTSFPQTMLVDYVRVYAA